MTFEEISTRLKQLGFVEDGRYDDRKFYLDIPAGALDLMFKIVVTIQDKNLKDMLVLLDVYLGHFNCWHKLNDIKAFNSNDVDDMVKEAVTDAQKNLETFVIRLAEFNLLNN